MQPEIQQQIQQQSKGFFSKLFDFSFRDFITPTIVAILYGILIVIAGIGAIALIVRGFSAAWYLGVIALVLSPIVFLLYVIMFRVYLEIVVALIRIAQNTTDMLRK